MTPCIKSRNSVLSKNLSMDLTADRDAKNLLGILIFLILLWLRLDCMYLYSFSLQLHLGSRRTPVISEPPMMQKIRGQRASSLCAGTESGGCFVPGLIIRRYTAVWLPRHWLPRSFCSILLWLISWLLSCGLPPLSNQESFSCKWPKPRSNCKELRAQRTERSLSKTSVGSKN